VAKSRVARAEAEVDAVGVVAAKGRAAKGKVASGKAAKGKAAKGKAAKGKAARTWTPNLSKKVATANASADAGEGGGVAQRVQEAQERPTDTARRI
jgi:hypothetical protein